MAQREQSTSNGATEDGKPPSTDHIIALAEAALAELPERLLRHVRALGIVVEDMADDATLDAMGIESGWDLSGLYRGVPITERAGGVDPSRGPDMVVLYRLPILLEWIEEDLSLAALVRHVLVHEIGHHLGFSEAQIEAINAGG